MFKPLDSVANKNHNVGKTNNPGDTIHINDTTRNSSARNDRGTNQCIPYSRVVPTRANLGRVTTGDAVFYIAREAQKRNEVLLVALMSQVLSLELTEPTRNLKSVKVKLH